MEAQQIYTFLHQVTTENHLAESRIVCPPAVLETGLKCSDSNDELNAKLCCVALPPGCAMDDAASFGRWVFVGIHTLYTAAWNRDSRKLSRRQLSSHSSEHQAEVAWSPDVDGNEVHQSSRFRAGSKISMTLAQTVAVYSMLFPTCSCPTLSRSPKVLQRAAELRA